ncbi:hypothetical protein Tco_1346801 [Tanacetum coccineum]
MGRDTIQLENAVSTISQEYLLEFTSEYGIPKDLHPEFPGPEDTIVDFPEGKVGIWICLTWINAPNSSKVKTGSRPRTAHAVPLLTVTSNRVIDMEDPAMAPRSSRTPSTVKRSPLDFDNENPAPTVTEGTRAEDQA